MCGSIIWVIIPLIGALILSWACEYFKWSESIVYDDLIVTFMTIGYIVLALISLGSVWNLITTAIYGPTNVMVIYLNDKGMVTKITDTYLRFVRAKHHDETICDRILSVDVYTPTIGSIFNTGSLTINYISFINADHRESSINICGVQNPELIKEKIMKGSPTHEGLKVIS